MPFLKSDVDQIDLVETINDITLNTKEDTTVLTAATDTKAGLMTGTDKERLDNLELNDLADVTKNIAAGYTGPTVLNVDGSGALTLNDDEREKEITDNMFFNGLHQKLSTDGWGADTFNTVTFGQDDSDLSLGYSLYKHDAGRVAAISDYFIRINPYVVYRMEASFKVRRTGTGSVDVETGDPENNEAGHFFGVIQYDSAGNRIFPQFNMVIGGSLSTLLSDYTPGDATMEVDNVDGWQLSNSSEFDRSIIAWDYTDSFGKLWMPGTYAYSRYIRNAWPTTAVATPITGGFSINMNTSPIATQFLGTQTLVAGTQISQGDSGGSFKYTVGANFKTVANSTSWERRYGYVGGLDLSLRAPTHHFSPGTSFIKVVILPNWVDSYNSDELLVSNVYIHPDLGANIEYELDTNAGPLTSKTASIYKSIATDGLVSSVQQSRGIMETS